LSKHCLVILDQQQVNVERGSMRLIKSMFPSVVKFTSSAD